MFDIFKSGAVFFLYKNNFQNLSPFWNNIFNYTTLLCWLPAFVFVALSWYKVKEKITLWLIYFLLCILLIFAEISLTDLAQLRASLAMSLCRLMGIIIFVFALNNVLIQKMIKKTKLVKLLIIIPFIVDNTYGISLELFMYYLFSKETTLIFQNLYYVLIATSSLTFLCTALSMWWAPKREIFI